MAKIFIPNPEYAGKVLVLIANSGIAAIVNKSILDKPLVITVGGKKMSNDISMSNVTIIDPDYKKLIATTCKPGCNTLLFAEYLKKQSARYKPVQLLKKLIKYGFDIGHIMPAQCI